MNKKQDLARFGNQKTGKTHSTGLAAVKNNGKYTGLAKQNSYDKHLQADEPTDKTTETRVRAARTQPKKQKQA